MRQPEREKGAALVLVLGIVALISAWAVSALRDDWLALQRLENFQMSTQARLAAESGLEKGRAMLGADSRSSRVDSLKDGWAQPVAETLENGTVVLLVVVDAGRFFNLNDLVDRSGQARPGAVAVAKRLFAHIDLSPQLVDAVVDWMDADHLPYGGNGRESADADSLFRIKNAPLDRLEELLLIPGFDAGIVERLRQVAVVCPGRDAVMPVNINTAPAEVLQSLGEAVDERDVAELLQLRQAAPFRTVAEMTARAPSFRLLDGKWLTVASDSFIIRASARVERAQWREEMMVVRHQGRGAQIVYRQRLAL